jgi:hypothetical protein
MRGPPPVCAVIGSSGAGTAGTIASARAAGRFSPPSPQRKPTTASRPAGAWPQTTQPPRAERGRAGMTDRPISERPAGVYHTPSPGRAGVGRFFPVPLLPSLLLHTPYLPITPPTSLVHGADHLQRLGSSFLRMARSSSASADCRAVGTFCTLIHGLPPRTSSWVRAPRAHLPWQTLRFPPLVPSRCPLAYLLPQPVITRSDAAPEYHH